MRCRALTVLRQTASGFGGKSDSQEQVGLPCEGRLVIEQPAPSDSTTNMQKAMDVDPSGNWTARGATRESFLRGFLGRARWKSRLWF